MNRSATGAAVIAAGRFFNPKAPGPLRSDPMTGIDQILRQTRTIALVGASDKPNRASFNILRYLLQSGYRVLPVNPALTEVLGQRVYPTLEAAQAALLAETGKGIDLVNVFRASEFVPDLVDEVLRLEIPYLWLQDGVEHVEATARARAAGVLCVANDCIFRQHAARPELMQRNR